VNGLGIARIGLAVLVLFASGFSVAWQWQANRYVALLAIERQQHETALAAIAAAAADQSRLALERQRSAQQRLADLDQAATQQKEHADAENQSLRRAVADGTRRLRIAGSCRASGGDVSAAASTASVGDAGTVELGSDAGQRVLDLRAALITNQAALIAAQAYIREVCLR
jgi:prophage endopeptidase